MFVHLIPKQFPCIGTIRIIKSISISGSYPVLQTIFHGLPVHPAFLVKFFKMFGRGIELRPYGNHHPPVHSVNRIHHRFWIRKTCLIKLMTSPSVFRPMVPVEHNIIYWNPTVAKSFQRTQYLGLCTIFFTALPISHCPFRHNRRLTGQGTVPTDDLVHIITGNEIIIQLLGHFTPPRLLTLLFRIYRTIHAESRI